MAKVVKHAWTHRPRSQGGTDPLPAPSVLQPYVYSYFDGSTSLDEVTTYSLGLLAPDAAYSGSGTALAEFQGLGNDDGTFVISEEGQIYHQGDPCILVCTATVLFPTPFDADIVSLEMDTQFTAYDPMATGALHVEKPFSSTAMLRAVITGTWHFWHDGGGIGTTDSKTLNVTFRHFAASAQSASWGSMLVTKLTTSEDGEPT